MKEVAEIVAGDTTDIYDSRAADLRPCGVGKYSSPSNVVQTRRDRSNRLLSIRIARPAGWPRHGRLAACRAGTRISGIREAGLGHPLVLKGCS